jgi:hypothetical protein
MATHKTGEIDIPVIHGRSVILHVSRIAEDALLKTSMAAALTP